MTERQILIIKISWSRIVQQSEEAGELFYGKLFELDPALRPLFKNNINFQARKLMNMLTILVAQAQHLDEVIGEIQELGRKHIAYGAQPSHYITVQQAFWWMLDHILENRWNVETQEAWSLLFRIISDKMLEAYPVEQ